MIISMNQFAMVSMIVEIRIYKTFMIFCLCSNACNILYARFNGVVLIYRIY